MWLDRIAGNSTPDRGLSPTPQRSSSSYLSPNRQNSRPALSRPGSSLSALVSPNASSASLPAVARVPEESTIKQNATVGTRPSDIADPLEVLNGILKKRDVKSKDESPTQESKAVKPALLVEEVDFDGLSLEEFVQKPEPSGRGNRTTSVQTIEQFENERDKFQELHTAISGCDDVSKSVEMYLSDFQNELGAVSAEIETLQTRSVQLNAMLENRRNVEQRLGPAVEEISISPTAVRMIAEGPIDESWVKALNEFENRTAGIEAKFAGSSSTKAIEDVRPLLEDVKKKVGPCCSLLGNTYYCRLLRGSETTWCHRYALYDRLTSTPRSSSKSAWSNSKIYTVTSHGLIPLWRAKLLRPTSTLCGGTT